MLIGRRLNTEPKADEIPNAIAGFELMKIGTGRLFERSDAEIAAVKAADKRQPTRRSRRRSRQRQRRKSAPSGPRARR